MSIRKKMLQAMVHDRSEPDKRSAIQSVSRRRTEQNYRFAAKYCAGARVLDIGPGFGLGYDHLLTADPEKITCMDYYDSAEAHFLFQDERIDFLHADFFANTLPDASFDVILCIATIYYLPDIEGFFTQVRRLLKPGGVLIINNFDRDVTRYYFGHELKDLSDRYGEMYTGEAFGKLLKQQLGTVPEHYLQSPVRLDGFSRFTLPIRLIFSPAVIQPAKNRLQGVYNYYVVRKA